MAMDSRFAVRYEDGAYEITREKRDGVPKLYYDLSPDGGERRFLRDMGEERLLLPSPMPGERLYFFLEYGSGPVLTAASRGVETGGVENFRDMGGYRTAEGKAVRWGRFFRGGPLYGLNGHQTAALSRLGIKRVVDYRTKLEAGRAPDECPEGADRLHLPAVPSVKRFQDFTDRDMLTHLRLVNTEEAAAEQFLLFKELYTALPFGTDAFRQMLLSLDSEGGVPLYQHCSAGKDRTGVGSVLLLLALGVDEETAVRDYLLSRDFRAEANRRKVQEMTAAGISREAAALLQRMMNVSEELIFSALHAIREKYPSYEAFFEKEYGFGGDTLSRWRQMYTA